jgi:hypothetical protein
MQDQKLRIDIIGDASKLNSALNTASGKLQAFGSKVSGIGKRLSVGLTLPLGIAGGAAIKMASDFEESMNKVNVAFKDASGEVKEFAKTTLSEFGIAQGTALDMAALFGDMSTSMGLTTKEAAKMSTSLVGLAGDLASFKNMNIEEVTTALNGVFTGETESLKRLGIVMTQVNLEQFAMEQGIKKTIKQMTQAEKVQLRYQFVMSKTANAQGDFARTSDGAANQMRIFQESMKELGANIGQLILPAFTKLVKFGNDLVKAIGRLSPEAKRLGLAFAGLAAAMPIILTVGGSLVTVFGAMLSPIGLIAAGLAAIAATIYTKWDGFKTVLVKIVNYFVDLYNESLAFRMIIQGTISYFKSFYRVAATAFSTVWNIIKGFVSNSIEAFKGLGDIITGVFTFDIDLIKEGFSKATEAAFDNLENIASEGGKLMDEASKIVAEEFTDGFERAYKAEPISHIVESDVQNFVDGIKDKISTGLKGIMPGGGAAQSIDLGSLFAVQEGALSADPIEQLASSSSWDELNKRITQSTENFKKMDEARAEHQEKMKELSMVVGGQLSGAFSELGNSMVASLGLGEGALGSFTASFLGAALDAVGAALSVSVANAIAGASAGSLLAGPVAPIVLPALIAGMVGLVKSQFASVPKFANGGIVSGPTMGLMGEYPGAKANPEVIAPLDKLQGMMGGASQNVNVGGEFKINGQDLVVALQRADRNRSRIK